MFRLNWAICGLLTMFLFPFVPVRAQAEKKEEKDRFTQRQRQHLKVYAAIQLASRNGQVPDDKIFRLFMGRWLRVVANSNQNTRKSRPTLLNVWSRP